MKILLTGGTGFIGRNLAVRLAQMGHHVTCLVRNRDKAIWMGEHPGLTPVVGEITDRESLVPHIGDVEVIFHLAGVTKARSREEYMRINGLGTGTLIDAASSSGEGVKRVIYVSSLAVAGPHTSHNPAKENGRVAPVTHYGESKLLGEQLLREGCRQFSWTIIRPPVVYGPYDRDVLVYFKLAQRGIVPVFGKTDMDFSIIHVDDLVSGIILAGFSDESVGEIFYLSDGRIHTIEGALSALIGVIGKGKLLRLPPLLGKVAGVFGDVVGHLSGKAQVVNSQKVKETLQDGWVCESEKIREMLGFHSIVGLEEGFESTYRWYRSAGWL